MRIFDITQEVFGCVVFPGDPAPRRTILSSMEEGKLYNLTEFSMCAHNGTHLDAPAHFIKNGKTIEQIPLSVVVGNAYVAEWQGTVSATDMTGILSRARQTDPDAATRILIKGRAVLSEEAARVLVRENVVLFGNESQTVGPEDAPMAVHLILLGAGVILLEGIRLRKVPEGTYLLNAAPLNLGGAEGAPCRAVLMDVNK
jgi:arylformamidase